MNIKIFKLLFYCEICLCFFAVNIFPQNVSVPKVVCGQSTFDFGTADNAGEVEHVFILENKGTASLVIQNVRACCGSTVKLKDKNIEPGTNTTLSIKLSLSGRTGRQAKSFYVMSNDPQEPIYQLRFVGTALPVVRIEPERIDFGQIGANTVSEQEIEIISPKISFKINQAIATGGQFTAWCEDSVSTNRHRIKVKTVPPIAWGVTHGKVVLSTDYLRYGKIEIPVMTTVQSDLVTAPNEILLVDKGNKPEPVTRYIGIRSRSGKKFRITQIIAPEPEMKTEIFPAGDGMCRIEIKNILPFEDLNGKKIILKTNHKETKEIEIPFRLVAADEEKK